MSDADISPEKSGDRRLVRPRSGARRRVGGVALILLLLLGAAFLVGSFTMNPQRSVVSPVEDAPGGLGTGRDISVGDGTITFTNLETGEREWALQASAAELAKFDNKPNHDGFEAVSIDSPRLQLFDAGGGGVATEIRASHAVINRKTQAAELRGKITCVLSPEDKDSVELRAQGPLILQLSREGDMKSAMAVCAGEVNIRSRQVDVSGTGAEADLRAGFLKLVSDVRVVARFEEGGFLPGARTLTLTCKGESVYRRDGGLDGVTPGFTFKEDVVGITEDASKLDCEQLDIIGATGAPGFLPELIQARGNAKLSLRDTGELSGDLLEARRAATGIWSTLVRAASGDHVTMDMKLKSGTGSPLTLSLRDIDTATYKADAGSEGSIILLGDIKGELQHGDFVEATLETNGEIEARLAAGAGGTGFASRISWIKSSGKTALAYVAGEDSALLESDGNSGPGFDKLQARASKSLRVDFDAVLGISSLVLVGDAEFQADGLSTPGGVAIKDGDSSPKDDQLVTAMARGDRITLTKKTEEQAQLDIDGSVELKELGMVDGQIRRRLLCESMTALFGDEGLTSTVARGTDTTNASFEDFTQSDKVNASGVSLSIEGQDVIVLEGSPATAGFGTHTISGEKLRFLTSERSVVSEAGVLSIKIAPEGGSPIHAVGNEVRLDEGRGKWVLTGSPATTSGGDTEGSYRLEAPRFEINPDTEDASCPQGGIIDVVRVSADGRREKVRITAGATLDYSAARKLVTATGGVHLKTLRGTQPFQIWADRTEGKLEVKPGSSPRLGTVTGIGNVKIISGKHEATGARAEWNVLTGNAVMTPAPRSVLRLTSSDRPNTVFKALKLIIKEDGTYTSEGLSIQRN